jgi:glycosyltransferase involved in cell wall biosynthesis
MRISVVAGDLPHPTGTAVGRDLWAWCRGLRTLGHEVDVWVWNRSPSSPEGPVPDWCRDERFDRRGLLDVRYPIRDGRGLERAPWEPAAGAVALADHIPSFPAVARFARAVATVHFRGLLDAGATRRLRRYHLASARGERFAMRRAALVLAYSERVAAGARGPVEVVPIAIEAPAEPLPAVEEPVAALLADWWWPPNKAALRMLLGAWPAVRRQVPGARLLLAGRHLEDVRVPALPGVEPLGEVADSVEVLSRAAVVAFPCPATSGPKVKVLEAMAVGRAVVTTEAGVEGLVVPPGDGAVVATPAGFADALAATLRDPARADKVAAGGRTAVMANHSALTAAQARVDAFRRHGLAT